MTISIAVGEPTFVAGYEAQPWLAGDFSIVVPGAVQTGDIGFILTGRDDSAAITATSPSGWTQIGTDYVAGNSNWRLLYRVRQAGDPATVAFGAGISGTVVAFWYRNATLGAIGTWWKRTATVNTLSAPKLTRTSAKSLILAIGGDRAIAATAGEVGYASVTGATYARRYDGNPTLNAGTQICGSIYAEISPTSLESDVTFTMNDSSGNGFGLQIELVQAPTWRSVSQAHVMTGGAWKQAKAMYTKVNGEWKQTFPADTGTPQIVGLRHCAIQTWSVTTPSGAGPVSVSAPGVPYYNVIGDKSQIASAYVQVQFQSTVSKESANITARWEAGVGWGIYLIVTPYQSDPVNYPWYWSYYYYYAALTDAEVAAIPSTKKAIRLWTPREGGWFAYMPVCWESAGTYTYPVRSDTDGGLDSHTLTGSTPANTFASVTAVDDGAALAFTVSEGYSTMSPPYDATTTKPSTTVTIQLKNSGGTVIASLVQAVAAPHTDSPGFARTIGRMGAPITAQAPESPVSAVNDWYWPVEWEGLFDRLPYETQMPINIKFGRRLDNGIAEWWVYDKDDERIGDFRLAMRKGITDTIEIHGVNLKPDLIGFGIAKSIVHYGTIWSPTRFVVLQPPDQMTYGVMNQMWGWTKLEDAPVKSRSALFHRVYSPSRKDTFLLYDTHVPMYNRFSELGYPYPEEVAQW
jgi:hypothetical protein